MSYTRERLLNLKECELNIMCGVRGLSREIRENMTKDEFVNYILRCQEMYQKPHVSFFCKMVGKICNIYKPIEIYAETHPDVIDIPETEDEKCCVICQEFRKFFAGKCGHLALCGKCSKDIWSKNGLCPICREPWKNIRQIFI